MNTAVIDADQVRELATWLEAQTWSNFALSLANHYRAHGSLTEKQLASAKSMFEKSQAREALRTRVAQLPELAIGTYIQPDKSLMWIIRKAKGSDNTYAMNKAFLGKTWTYVRNGKATLSNLVNIGQAHVLTLEEAVAIGQAVGHCVMCGAQLTDPESIARGIGPVCATKL
jgi:hypothetical protein